MTILSRGPLFIRTQYTNMADMQSPASNLLIARQYSQWRSNHCAGFTPSRAPPRAPCISPPTRAGTSPVKSLLCTQLTIVRLCTVHAKTDNHVTIASSAREDLQQLSFCVLSYCSVAR